MDQEGIGLLNKSRLQKYTLTNKGEQYFGKEDDDDLPF